MNDLIVRKRLLIAQADLHRRCLELECQRLAGLLTPARGAAAQEPWWLRTVMMVGGVLLPPKWQGLLRFLPLAPNLLRLIRP